MRGSLLDTGGTLICSNIFSTLNRWKQGLKNNYTFGFYQKYNNNKKLL